MLKRFSLLFFPVAAIITGVICYIDTISSNSRMQAVMQQETMQMSQQAQIIHQVFDSVVADMVILSRHSEFNVMQSDGIDSVSQSHLQALAKEFQQFHMHKPHYDEVRLIDPSGMERIRTDYDHRTELARISPPSHLRNVSSLQDFLQTMRLGRRQIHVTLIEKSANATSQRPNPSLQFSIPLFGSDGTTFGMIALKYNLSFLLERINQVGFTTDATRLLSVNMGEYWLKSPGPGKPWQLVRDNQADLKHPGEFKRLMQRISSASSGQFESINGLYSFTRINPLEPIKGQLENNTPRELLYTTVPVDFHWTLVSLYPSAHLANILHPSGSLITITTMILLCIWAYISFLLARYQHGRQLALEALEENQAKLSNIFDSAFNGIITINEYGFIDSFNPAAAHIFGYAADEIIGNNVSMLIPSPHRESHDQYLRRYITSGESRVVGTPREVEGLRKSGELFPVELCVTARQVGTHWLFVGMIQDISERKAMQEKLHAMATRDGLTGIYNRAAFNERLSREFKRARRYRLQLSLLMFDADHFKSVNDRYGHPAGDALLIAIAEQAKLCIRDTDMVARYGGEEFSVILPETDCNSAAQLAERLRLAIEGMQVEYEGQTLVRTVSIGVSCLQNIDELTDEDDLLKAADRALYTAKENGRNRVSISSNTELTASIFPHAGNET